MPFWHVRLYLALCLFCVMLSAGVIACEQSVPTATVVSTPESTATVILDATDTPEPQALAARTPEATEVPTVTPTPTPVPTDTATPVPTVTSTPMVKPTAVPTDTPTATPDPVLADRAVLVEFYNATDGGSWKVQTNWLSDRPIGEWFGVTTNRDGRIVKLELVDNGLRGSLPESIGDLTELEILQLGKNNIVGRLPASMGELSDLRELILEENGIFGGLPVEMSKLGDLEVLDVFSNRFSGEIPGWVGDLVELKVLDLGSNRFGGEIPPALADLRRLQVLRLDDNDLEGELPPSIGHLSEVEELRLSGNELSGSIPAEFGGLRSVKWLRLQSNLLGGQIPDELSLLSNLIELDLNNNRLEGPLPEWLGEFEGLTALHISGNAELTGCLPEGLSGLENSDFGEFHLGWCGVEPDDRQALVALYETTDGANWTNNTRWLSDAPIGEWHGIEVDEDGSVTEIQLGGNGLRGKIPSKLRYLQQLVILRLNENDLTGSIPPELGELSNLVSLELSDNRLSGAIPVELGRLSKLNTLWLARNALSGEIPIELSHLSELRFLLLHENLLTGQIPFELSELGNLIGLSLNGNWLDGEIPQELVGLHELEILFIAGNNGLTGCVPYELQRVPENDLSGLDLAFCSGVGVEPAGDFDRDALVAFYNATDGPNWKNNTNWLSDLQISRWYGVVTNYRGKVIELNLAENNLVGSIPPEIGDLTELAELSLSGNKLSGPIPIELGSLARLRILFLYSNRLTGNVPKELGNLSNLRNLRLDFNRLTGEIPPELGNLVKLENFEILENNLSGEIPDELGDIPGLRQLFVSRNYAIIGCLPDGLLDLASDDFHDVWLDGCSTYEERLLAEFYEAMDGVNWEDNAGWLSEQPLSEWYGITVNQYGRVVGLELSDNNLNGVLPETLALLTKLESVRVSGNAITGCVSLSLSEISDHDFDDLMLSECSVHFPDTWLRDAMLERLGKEPGSDISALELAELESLDLSWSFVKDLEGLQYATNLRKLTLGVSPLTPRPDEDSFRNYIFNLGPISELSNLEELYLARCGLTDIAALSNLPKLEYLDIGFNRLDHIGPVLGLNNLETLLVSGNHVDNITGMSSLDNLVRLDISDNKIDDFAPVVGLDRLRELDISHNEVMDVAFVSNLQQLHRLGMSGVGIADLSSINELRGLIDLDVSWNEIEDLSPLSALDALRTLKIGPAPVRDITPLSELAELRELLIVGTELSDVSALRDLVNLRSLVLSDNRIFDLSPLEALAELQVLDLNFNDVEDVSPLEGLTKLEVLRLNGNNVGDIGPLVANLGLGHSDRVELNSDVRHFAENRFLARHLVDRDVDLHYDAIYATGYGEPKIHNENVFVLPVPGSQLMAIIRLKDFATDFYESFRDEFDFLIIVSNVELGDDVQRPYKGRFALVRNDVEGIGTPPYHDDELGSESRLQGVVHLPFKEGFGEGPVLHELMHRWGNLIVEGGYPGHWGWSSVHGVLGGFNIDELVDLGDGRYDAGHFSPNGFGGDFMPYAALELYLAGLGPAEEVPDWITGVDAWFAFTADGRVEEYEDRGHVFTTEEFKTYTIEDIIAKHGPRVPDYSESQKEFRAAAILLIDGDHPATTEVVDEISRQVSRFSHPGDDDDQRYNFYEATKGRGTMLMGDLSKFLKEGVEE